jgi:two-component system, LytTR family, sensor histidine kinase AlgZ
MHPILADRKRLALYLIAWITLAVLLALLVLEAGRTALASAVMLTLPPTLVYAFVCLAAWFPTRAAPLARTSLIKLVLTHVFAAVVLSGVWLMLFQSSARLHDSLRGGTAGTAVVAQRSMVLIVTGALLYLLAVAFHYVLSGLEEARRIEQREMAVRMLAREAELKALKAQLDPHFLFNALNSISSLCGSSPSSARTLTTLLAEYLRKSLRYGNAESITLSEELELASSYLAIERVRFGDRLQVAQNIDERVRDVRVPPLLLQPLVENAVTHGVAHLLEGGTVEIAAERDGDHVRISVENRCDPDRVPHRGEGIGLANTRKRVEAFYGGAARLQVIDEPARFSVGVSIPA